MELQYYGANSLKITTKKSVVSVDPVSDIVNLSSDLKKTNTVLATQDTLISKVPEGVFVISSPGEYEFEDYSVKGVAAQAHTASVGDKSATVYRITAADIRLLVVGHTAGKLSEEQLEEIGVVDVVVVPVGGGGYTLDPTEAVALVRTIEPKLVIPVHCAEDKLDYSVPQAELDLFVKELGVPVLEGSSDKYKVKILPDQMSIQLLSRS